MTTAAANSGPAARPAQLAVCEVFGPTFQGEGPSAGNRAFFQEKGNLSGFQAKMDAAIKSAVEVGTAGRRFDALSFRTTLHAENPELPWHRASYMTRLGPYLRYTGIDVLPQLFNVLRGEMSITDIGAYESGGVLVR